MGYLSIPNLYKYEHIFCFKRAYALEKIDGTSAGIFFKDGNLRFHAGGANHQKFVGLFDQEKLKEAFIAMGHEEVCIHGEAYGGKIQKMAATYGPNLKFIVFDVKVCDTWVTVPNAENIAQKLGLEFVPYAEGPAELAFFDLERVRPSEQSIRNGIQGLKTREGIVIRPTEEFFRSNGERIIVKYKNEEFRETASPREVDPGKLKILADAEQIAFEWVTDIRLNHVIQKLNCPIIIENTGPVCKTMVADIEKEGEGEIMWSFEVKKAIGRRTSELFKKKLQEELFESGIKTDLSKG